MDWKLEVVRVPVSDVDQAKRVYSEQADVAVDIDARIAGGSRFVQLTPPGSACSEHLEPEYATRGAGGLASRRLRHQGCQGRTGRAGRGGGPVQHFERADFVGGRGGDSNSFVFISDPDGNG